MKPLFPFHSRKQMELAMHPAGILQSYLDDVGRMVIDGDFESYANHVVVPFKLVTATANLTVATLDELQDGFDDFVSMLEDMRVTALLRKVINAQSISESMITGTYTTVHLGGEAVVVPEFYSKIWLRRIDGFWKATEIRNTTRDERWPIISHKVDSDA